MMTMIKGRKGFEWIERCLECKNSCAIMGGCELGLLSDEIFDFAELKLIKCTGYIFDGIKRHENVWRDMTPEILRRDMFLVHRLIKDGSL